MGKRSDHYSVEGIGDCARHDLTNCDTAIKPHQEYGSGVASKPNPTLHARSNRT